MGNTIVGVSHEEIREAVLYLQRWQAGQNSFTCQLFGVIQKADIGNMAKLRVTFPAEVKAYELWQSSPDEDAFFREWLE